jgi:hypothetical protein
VLAAGITAVGYWAQKRQLTMRYFVGVGILAVILAGIGEVDAGLAEKFGALIVAAALLYYGVPIAKAFGYTK